MQLSNVHCHGEAPHQSCGDNTEFSDDERAALPPVPQALVRVHTGSGRKTLYLASHASQIIGWPIEQGRALLNDLIEFSTQPCFVYQHRWRVGDLVAWDNRCSLHRARPYDDTRYRRDMRRTTVEGSAATVQEALSFGTTAGRGMLEDAGHLGCLHSSSAEEPDAVIEAVDRIEDTQPRRQLKFQSFA
jgi:Taurine catabolism dioxygenase TauD, TfdA family